VCSGQSSRFFNNVPSEKSDECIQKCYADLPIRRKCKRPSSSGNFLPWIKLRRR
jgi:hypothetical protein